MKPLRARLVVATAASEQTERGLLLVDLTRYDTDKSLTFGYMPEGALENLDEQQQELLQIYNPQREFIISLYKSGGHIHTYLGQMPELGWWEELQAAPYPPLAPDHTSN